MTRILLTIVFVLQMHIDATATTTKINQPLRTAINTQIRSLIDQYEMHEPPTIGGLQMPKRMWWYVQVAAACAKVDPILVACVLRYESAFKVGPIGNGKYVGPGGIHRAYRSIYPIDDEFINILITAWRLGVFRNIDKALAAFNADRGPKLTKYCRTIKKWARKLHRRKFPSPVRNEAWRQAVLFGKLQLAQLRKNARSQIRR